jgi:hypothetical protein
MALTPSGPASPFLVASLPASSLRWYDEQERKAKQGAARITLSVTPAQAHCCPGKKRDHQETRRRGGSHGLKGAARTGFAHKVAATCSCGSEPCSCCSFGAGPFTLATIDTRRSAGTRSGWPLWVTSLGHSRNVTRPPAGGRNTGAIGADTIAKTPPKNQPPIPPSPHETYRRSRVGLWPIRSHVSDNKGLHK